MPSEVRVGHIINPGEVTYVCLAAFVVAKFPLVAVGSSLDVPITLVVLECIMLIQTL